MIEVNPSTSLIMDDIESNLKKYNQVHLLKFFGNLTSEQQVSFLSELSTIDWGSLMKIYEEQVQTQIDADGKVKPSAKLSEDLLRPLVAECIDGNLRANKESIERYRSIGLSEIAEGRVAALVMAGGQGTRLGVNYPKGMYNIIPESNISLFHLQFKRIQNVMKASNAKKPITYYVMTSIATTEATKEYFEENNYFGLNDNQVVFFEQNNIPSFDFGGRVLLDQYGKLAKSPDGNGGIFDVLHDRGIIQDMKDRGIEHLHVHSVDNALVRVCDPVFMGYCISKGVDAGAKVVEKTDPSEAVGTICNYDGKFKVIEYTEIPTHLAQLREPQTGRLVYNAGNICDQYFKVQFLDSIKDQPLEYHLAIKKIPHIDLTIGERVKPEQPNGIKLEKFIFDVFKLTDKFAAWEVIREDEFSPVKNAPGTAKDNPETALAALRRAYKLGLIEI